jgi:hypothetical protein
MDIPPIGITGISITYLPSCQRRAQTDQHIAQPDAECHLREFGGGKGTGLFLGITRCDQLSEDGIYFKE